ncbi:MAG TPA: alpha/beta fold hydrolase [Candidatus Nitrosotalea sp.]|nr:alpha/beta fold hydrolase [Candidatus Nitrosotalea sp.]
MFAAALIAGALHTQACVAGKARLPALCGALTVYENRAAATGRTIDLRFVVIKAAHPSGRALAWNPGGPGASATADADAIADGTFFKPLSDLRERFDILLVDNRGTGGSAPQQCDLTPPAEPQLYFNQLWHDALVGSCRLRLARTADLSLYTTSIAADDLNQLRAALGYRKLVLVGGSYGTRFFMVYARRHPESVESLVLDGVAPPHFLIIPLQDARGAQLAVTRLIEECNADAACKARFPAFGQHFYAVARRFDSGPVGVPLHSAKAAGVTNVPLSKEVFADRFRQLLYSPASAAYAPFIIERAYRYDYRPLATMVDVISQGFAGLLNQGLNLSVTCAEDIPFITEGAVLATSANSFEGDLRVRAQQRACRIWSVRPVPATFNTPVRSTAPILMISGTDDPTSPPGYAEAALRSLPNARILLIRNASHGTETACSDRLIVAFVLAGSAKGLDLAECSGGYRRPAFATSMAGFGD